ncbi:MAG TPA: hypothetical protein VN698_10405 [Bacteroidia bacterium]|nr:hypothetical protein [Bacteroidia bacterium]
MNKNTDEIIKYAVSKRDILTVLKNENLANSGALNEYYMLCGQISALNALIDFFYNKDNMEA